MEQPTPTLIPFERPRRKIHWKPILIIVGAIIVVALGIVLYWRFFRSPNPEKELQLLEQSSQPVTETPAQRKAELEALQEQSEPITTTPEQRLRALEQLRQ